VTAFQYSPQIIENYPQVVAGVIIAKGMSNPPTASALRDAYFAEQDAVKARIGDTPLSEIESLNAWRRAISAFGVSPTKYRSAAEALLRRLTKKGDIPSINTLVDLGNLVSIRYAVPVAIFDTRELDGVITVHYSDGTESFTELGSGEVQHPEVGEVVFSDDRKMIVARRWCWRQSATSAANDDTADAVIVTEAHHDGAQADIQHAIEDLRDLLRAYAGGTFDTALLTADKPSF